MRTPKRPSDPLTEGVVVKLDGDPTRLYLETVEKQHYLLHQFTDIPNKSLVVGMRIKGILHHYNNGGGYVHPGTVVVMIEKTPA